MKLILFVFFLLFSTFNVAHSSKIQPQPKQHSKKNTHVKKSVNLKSLKIPVIKKNTVTPEEAIQLKMNSASQVIQEDEKKAQKEKPTPQPNDLIEKQKIELWKNLPHGGPLSPWPPR